MLPIGDGNLAERGFSFCMLDFEKLNLSSGHRWLRRNFWYGWLKPVEALVSPVPSLQDSSERSRKACLTPAPGRSTFCLSCIWLKAFKKLSLSVRMAPGCPLPVLCPSKSPRGQKPLSFRRTARLLQNTAVRTAVLSSNHHASGEVERWRGRRIETLSEGRG